MSKIVKFIELSAPKHGLTGRDEVFRVEGFNCPECYGNGYHWGIDRDDPTGHDHVKIPCRSCGGTGTVSAEVRVTWGK